MHFFCSTVSCSSATERGSISDSWFCSHPADVYPPNWMRGQLAALDVTVISPMQQLTIAGAAESPRYALTVGKDRKMAAHSTQKSVTLLASCSPLLW